MQCAPAPDQMARSAPPPPAPLHKRVTAKGSRHAAGEVRFKGEDTPAYKILTQHGLLDTSYRLETSEQIDATPENATRLANLLLNIFCCPAKCCFSTFEVDAAKLRLVEDGRGGFEFAGPGVHRICDPFYRVGKEVTYSRGVIQHGDLTVVVVEQGHIGFALDQGQPILLPPGLHQWRSPTMKFEKSFDLNNNVIRMGPFTLVTVDSGYSAITENNGEQKILAGGATYFLTHRNWKFQKYIPQKIQSDTLKRIEATSADNVLMAVDATVIWRITDVETAALNSAETISKNGSESIDNAAHDLGNLNKLKNDVLKQAEASLAAFIGAVEYSSTFSVAAATSNAAPNSALPIVEGIAADGGGSSAASSSSSKGKQASNTFTIEEPTPTTAKARITSPLFDLARLQTCVDHANEITRTYGVRITSINVVAAVPADKTLMVSLAQGAVAAAEAQKFETVASGKAAAAKIEAKGVAEADVLKARGAAESERVRAEGHRAAAALLSENEVAVKLATIDRTGHALDSKKAFFFGSDPKDLGSLLASSLAEGVIKTPSRVDA